MFLNQDALVGIYASSSAALPKVQLSNFSVQTNSGTIQVNWGDGFVQTIVSTTPNSVSHSFSCPASPAASGFWNNIQPCI